MVTGDNTDTARAIARSIGLIEDHDEAVLPGEHIRDPDEMGEDEQRRLMRAEIGRAHV